jgi:threonine-phosphate decarboxylase
LCPAPAEHGGLDFVELARLGLRAEEVLDFSANVNPYGPPPGVREALAGVPLDRYPDRECLALRAALAEQLGVSRECVLPGNGASELIGLAALAFLRPGDRALVLGPTYAEYARAARLAGARVVNWQAREEDNFSVSPEEVLRELRRVRPQLVFVCTPNNPTGTMLEPGTVARWARRLPRTRIVVDEAYLPFVPDSRSSLDASAANVLVLGSLTKDFGLAGLRLGFAAGPASLLEPLRRLQPPWSVNALSQAAGVAALRDPGHHARTLGLLAAAKADLAAGLSGLGLEVLPSAGPFFLVRVGDGAGFRRVLLERGILVRDATSFGLPAYVRISPRTPEENGRLLAAVREVSGHGR